MKRERALQVVLVLVGLFYCFWGYLLFDDLWHSRWLSGHSDVMPMFLSLNTALGVCLLVAVNQPAKHRLMIAYGAWSSLAHGFTMTIMSAQAVAHGMHRKDSPQDIVIFGVIGVTLLALLPAKQPSPARLSVSRALPKARGPGPPPRAYRDAGTPHGSAAIRFVDYMLGLAAVLILHCRLTGALRFIHHAAPWRRFFRCSFAASNFRSRSA